MFSPGTPQPVKERIQNEFLRYVAETAIKCLVPLYKIDFRENAKKLNIPVVAIISGHTFTIFANNRKYFKNFEVVTNY